MGETEQQPVRPAADEQADSPTAKEGGRLYTCLNCGRQFCSFTQECPDCGGNEFRTGEAETTDTEEEDELLKGIAAKVNPYIPR